MSIHHHGFHGALPDGALTGGRNHFALRTIIAIIFLTHVVSGATWGQFTQVIDIPPSPNRGHLSSIGNSTQLNLFDGGEIGDFFQLGSILGPNVNIELNVYGGVVGSALTANPDTNVNVFGGRVGSLNAQTGAIVQVSGGIVDGYFSIGADSMVLLEGGAIANGTRAFAGSEIIIMGGDYLLDGTPIEGLSDVGDMTNVNIPLGSVLSGTFADGTPFAFSSRDGDEFAPGTLTLSVTDLPPVSPANLVVPGDAVPLGIRTGQMLTLEPGGMLPNQFNAGPGSVLVVNGGEVGENLESTGAHVTINGGILGEDFDAFTDSIVQIAGGMMRHGIHVTSGAQLHLAGGDFRLNGQPIDGLDNPGDSVPLDVAEGDVLSGVLADGSPFAWVSHRGDVFDPGTLTLTASELPKVVPTVITAPSDPVPSSIRGPQTLVVENGGFVGEHFKAGHGSTVIINGGNVDHHFEAGGATVHLNDGAIGNATFGNFAAFSGTVVNISGGTVSSDFHAYPGSEINITGGVVQDRLNAYNDSVVNMTGGRVGTDFAALDGAQVNLNGGVIGDRFAAHSGSSVHVSGGDFRLNGETVEGLLNENDTRILNVPADSVLTGILADGTPFAFAMSDVDRPYTMSDTGDSIADGALRLTVTSLPSVGPDVIMVPGQPAPTTMRGSQTLILEDGGLIGDHFRSGPGSTLQMSGGRIGVDYEAIGTEINITGGVIEERFDVFSGSVVNISGTAELSNFEVHRGGIVNILGDGLVNFTSRGGLVNIRGGSNVSFSLSGGQVRIANGASPRLIEAHDGQLDIVGGFFGGPFITFSPVMGSTHVNLFAGTIDYALAQIQFDDHSVLNIVGGTLKNSVQARGQSEINIAAGRVERNLRGTDQATINISGGVIEGNLSAFADSAFNLYGTEFLLDGQELPGLVVGEPFTIGQREVLLEARLADGSLLSFVLSSTLSGGQFDPSATITITLIDSLTGDYNDDGLVNAADFIVWRNHLGESITLPNEDPITTPGVVTEADLYVWRHNFGRAALSDPPLTNPIPEPAAGTLAALMAIFVLGATRCRAQ